MITIAGCTVFVAVVAYLHIRRPDLPPLERGISRYTGQGTLVLATVSLLSLAIALTSLAARLESLPSRASTWLFAAVGGLLLAAVTPIGADSPSRARLALHTVGGGAFYLGAVGAMVLTDSSGTEGWFARAGIAALVVFVLGGVGAPGLRAITGLSQRVVFAFILVWAVRAAIPTL